MLKSPILKVLCFGAVVAILVTVFLARERNLDAQVAELISMEKAMLAKAEKEAESQKKENQSPARLKAAKQLLAQLKTLGRQSKAPWASQIVKVRAYDGMVVIDTNLPPFASQEPSFRSLCEVTTSLAYKLSYAAMKPGYVDILTKNSLPGAHSRGANGACDTSSLMNGFRRLSQ